MPPRAAHSSCCTRSVPTISGSCLSTPKASSRRARSDTRSIPTTSPIACPPWSWSRPMRSSSLSARRSTSQSFPQACIQMARLFSGSSGVAPHPDGLAVFPLREDGSLGTARFYDAGGGSPFYIAFLHGRPDTFVIGYAVGDGVSMGTIEKDDKVSIGPLVKIDTSAGLPSELCWLAVSPDDRTIYATNFGYSNISSYRINGGGLEIACDPACPRVPGDGTARGLCGDVTSGPADNWITPDGAYLYQIYGNAAKLVGYATQPDGSLNEITSVKIPYNSPQGLVGF